MSVLNISQTSGEQLEIPLDPGEVLYVLGANGAGKSTLLFKWSNRVENATLIVGNRDVSFGESSVSLSASDVSKEKGYARNVLRQDESRYGRSHHNNEIWLRSLVFQLKAKGEYLNDQYRQFDLAGKSKEKEKCNDQMPLNRLNAAFMSANLSMSFEWTELSKLFVKKENIPEAYPFNSMSDGERAAFILSAAVILAADGTMILIDEPERHLHRSISRPLMSYFKALRPDLKWVISTHDLSLPADEPEAKVLSVYSYDGTVWCGDLVENTALIDPAISTAVYGARRQVLFVEGRRNNSLDFPLYRLMFPQVQIEPVGSCTDVRNAVKGLNKTQGLHHMQAKGLIDFDNRTDLGELEDEGVYALKVYAIESLYYQPSLIQLVQEHLGQDGDVESLMRKACESINDGVLGKIAQDIVQKDMRRTLKHAEHKCCEFVKTEEDIKIVLPNPKQEVLKVVGELKELVQGHDWKALLTRVKIKSSPAPKVIAKELGLKDACGYEKLARKRLREDTTVLAELKAFAPVCFQTID